MNERSNKLFDSFTLKMIAIITMAIDHIGYIFLPGTDYYSLSRGIGRLAFPIFCFLIVEGFHHTKSPLNYLLRLLVFALISEVPFDLAFFGKTLDMQHQNVFFTLAIGLCCLFCLEEMNRRRWFSIFFILLLFAAYFIKCDYGVGGVLLICIFYLTKDSFWVQLVLTGLIFYMFFGTPELLGLISVILIYFYNGKRGYNKAQWFFYIFYPLHLIILHLISIYM